MLVNVVHSASHEPCTARPDLLRPLRGGAAVRLALRCGPLVVAREPIDPVELGVRRPPATATPKDHRADRCIMQGMTALKNVPSFEVKAIGRVESSLTDLESAPRQPDEGAPEAWLVFEPEVLEGLQSLRPGDEVLVLTWLDRARRDVLSVHPRGDTSRPQEGVFSTRSPHRPNPIGLHRAEITAIDGRRVRVRHLEALDGTPILDVKPVLSGEVGER